MREGSRWSVKAKLTDERPSQLSNAEKYWLIFLTEDSPATLESHDCICSVVGNRWWLLSSEGASLVRHDSSWTQTQSEKQIAIYSSNIPRQKADEISRHLAQARLNLRLRLSLANHDLFTHAPVIEIVLVTIDFMIDRTSLDRFPAGFANQVLKFIH